MSIKQLIIVVALSVSTLLVGSVVFSLWVFATAEQQLSRAVYSYEQLAIATGLETDAARALLAAALIWQGDPVPDALAVDKPAVDASVDALIGRIRDEIGSLTDSAQQAEEAEEFLTAFAIRENYARLARAVDQRSDAGEIGAASLPVDAEALGHFLALDAQLGSVVSDEREEVVSSLATVSALRDRLRSYVPLAASAALLATVLAAYLIYRGLMGPLQTLDAGSAQLADGDIGHRIAGHGPPEFRQLASRLNDMAGRLEDQRNTLRDVNEQLEQTVEERTRELADKARRLEEIDKSRRLFFAKVGHELRTPLTVMLGEAEVMLREVDASAADYREALEHIEANGAHLKRRIADLLAVARSDDGLLRIDPRPVDLAGLARATVATARGYARSNEVTLVLRLQEQSLWVRADGDWLQQALLGLVDNAIKFAPAGSQVEVALTAGAGAAVLSVTDRGPGVPDAELPLLAQPYFQSESAAARGGTGLGLAVAHWVASQHGGALFTDNRPEGGLQVSLEVPAGPAMALGVS